MRTEDHGFKFAGTVQVRNRRDAGAKLAADGDFDWFKDDFNTASFKGTAVLADGNTAPYTFEVYK